MNRIVIRWAIVCICILCHPAVRAQDSLHVVHRFSLDDCIAYAIAHELNLQSAKIDAKITEAKEKEVTGLALPRVTASGQFQDYLKLPTTLFPDFFSPAVYAILKQENLIPQNKPVPQAGLTPVQFGTQYNLNTSLNASQTLFDPSVFVALQARETILELARKNVKRTERDLKVTVSKAYYNVWIARKQLQVVKDNIARLEKLLHDTRVMYQNGFAEKLDVDRLQVQLNNLKSQETEMQNMVTLSDQLLKFQIGMPLQDSLQLTDSLGFDDVKSDLLQDEEVDLHQRIDYQTLQTQLKANQFDLKRYQLAWLPSLSANASYGINAARTSFNFFDHDQPWFKTFYVGLNLSVPLFEGLQKKYRIDQAKLNVQKSQLQLELLDQSMQLELQQARTNLSNYLLNVASQQKNMELAQEVYEQTIKKYEAGVGSTIEINNAEGDLQQAQLNYYTALYNAMLAKIDYLKAIGKL
ncbi:outer membrane protein TolC [Thermoflavifilum aggregans]|uniref:Outer membrane protein TolC n=1 Tax=Thermoflavifilum aggregans TaxID=454188 RepID=A0A2M9CRQ0_9BACT|nr:TolC family protein [Thermoflavifilum aggregans]PJJ74521.1 outer membrane protein TolC [Thermoflavifilum aggregans]